MECFEARVEEGDLQDLAMLKYWNFLELEEEVDYLNQEVVASYS